MAVSRGGLAPHTLPWPDFDAVARGLGGPEPVRTLRAAERSRRLLLLRGLIESTTKSEDLYAPLPSPDWAWDLLARAQEAAPAAVETILAHPYTGSWVGYTTRLCRQDVTGVCPLWVHIGHVHCLAAAAATRAGLAFETEVPVWRGNVSLPTLGMAVLRCDAPFSVARVVSRNGAVEVRHHDSRVVLPPHRSDDGPGWLGVRRIAVWCGERRLAVRLDDLDPYRGLYEPIPPRRLGAVEVESWRTVLSDAWQLLVTHLPEVADALPDGLDSIVPEPAVPFRLPSASTGEAFGSAMIAYGSEPARLAAALVHEFHHIRLGGLQHLTSLHVRDVRERLYAPWRDDPRPIGGVLHGIYAFFGVTSLWRALASAEAANRLAAFEFALWREQTWRTLVSVRQDEALTDIGRRFLDGVAARLAPWQEEPVTSEAKTWADRAARDHHATWRLRHLRPDPAITAELAAAWRAGESRPATIPLPEPRVPTPVPDGPWTDARTDLLRLRLGSGSDSDLADHAGVPGATPPDRDFVSGRTAAAIDGYRRLCAENPDDPSALIGLGLALAARSTGPVSRALLHRPEVVRAVHRQLRSSAEVPTVESIAGWLGRFTH